MRSFLERGPLPERVDIVILGGGINGVALARECAQAHKSVLLLERHDFASGSTSRCDRSVHGGLPYLEQGELKMLRDALHGRENLLRQQPHLVRPLEFVIAAGPHARYSPLEIRSALWLYRKLGHVSPTSDPASDAVEALRAALDPSQHWDLFPYLDAQCEFPERLVAAWLAEACAAGAVARNHAEVLSIRTSGEGRACGVLVRDDFTAQDSYIQSEWIINAAGPWVDTVRNLTGLASRAPLIRPMRNTYLVLRRFPGAPSALALQAATIHGRHITVTPWNSMLQVGCTQANYTGDPAEAAPTPEEVAWLFSSVAALFPHASLTSADVVYSYAGVRPLQYHDGPEPLRPDFGSVANPYVLHNHADEGALGMLSIFGGTLSTAALLARRTARTMGIRLASLDNHKPAADLTTEVSNAVLQWASVVQASTGIPRETAEALALWHGRHAMCVVQAAMRDPILRQPILDGHPQLVAQALEAVSYEHAVTLADILLRRVPLALNQDWNEHSTMQAATRIAPALGWNERRMKEEMESFELERARFLHKPRELSPNGVAA